MNEDLQVHGRSALGFGLLGPNPNMLPALATCSKVTITVTGTGTGEPQLGSDFDHVGWNGTTLTATYHGATLDQWQPAILADSNNGPPWTVQNITIELPQPGEFWNGHFCASLVPIHTPAPPSPPTPPTRGGIFTLQQGHRYQVVIGGVPQLPPDYLNLDVSTMQQMLTAAGQAVHVVSVNYSLGILGVIFDHCGPSQTIAVPVVSQSQNDKTSQQSWQLFCGV